ncbi:hypothetical protein [Gottfriedia acidiceleris]|uniref:Uncharacterized protein n=1 Tax=Gottfriedia acidiceleris TaxID=371036 RepID=A0ABY4JIU3_9BACI|nr:hypothetical protein [Gottfriedia acidiceleris]UPM53761.1 hypothetical protein MY490_18585 [Gottfriedia acidiceleris]
MTFLQQYFNRVLVVGTFVSIAWAHETKYLSLNDASKTDGLKKPNSHPADIKPNIL